MDGDSGYRPVACDFHDQLEAYSVTRRRVRIVHVREDAPESQAVAGAPVSGAGAPETSHDGLIQDIYTTERKEEFLRLEDGTTVRLDRITRVEALT